MRILYIDIDTLRPDHLGCYGYHRNTSPNIDAIAANGTRFTSVYASDVPCLPSRTALVTGTFGIRNGENHLRCFLEVFHAQRIPRRIEHVFTAPRRGLIGSLSFLALRADSVFQIVVKRRAAAWVLTGEESRALPVRIGV